MDEFSMGAINRLKKNGGVGYTETSFVEVYNEVNYSIYDEVEVSDSYFNLLGRSFADQNWAKDGSKVIVVWDGVKYECNIMQFDDGSVEFGNHEFLCGPSFNGDLPFLFEGGGIFTKVYARDQGEHSFIVYAVNETVHPIDLKYLPDNCELVTVDLAECEVEPSAALPVPNFNLAILALFSSGGGVYTFADDSIFWKTVSGDKPVRFMIDASSLRTGLTIEAEAKSCVKYTGALHTIETSFMVNYNGWYRVSVMFQNNFDGTTTVIVSVERLTIPGM